MPSMDRQGIVVFLTEERVFGTAVGPIGAHFTLISYTYMGNDYEVLVENDDFEIVGDDEDEEGIAE